MIRRIQLGLLITILAIASLENKMGLVYRSVAQETTMTETCNPDQSLQSRMVMALEEARSALERKNWESVLDGLQAGLPLAQQLKNTTTQSYMLQEWLLDANEGYPTTRLQRLMQLVEIEQNSAEIKSVLDEFLQLSYQLNAENSFVKARSLAVIARQYAILDQPELAQEILQQADQAADPIEDPIFLASALIEIAEGYGAIAQPEPTQTILMETEQAIAKIPENTSEPLKLTILERMAAVYAQVGNYEKANQIAQALPENSDTQSVALRGIVAAYIAAQNLETAAEITEAIASPSQKVPALTQLAIAYHHAEQPDKASELLRQAAELAESPAVSQDLILQDALIKDLVQAHLAVGKRDEAFRLAKTYMTTSQAESLKTVMVAYAEAGQTDIVQQWLSEKLTNIASLSDSWEQRLYLPDVFNVVIATQQFDWVLQEWNRIAAIDYGPQDWQMIQLATAYAQTGQYNEAVAWVEELPVENRFGLDVKLLAAIALTAHENGNTEWAKELLQKTLGTIDETVARYQAEIDRNGGDLFERDRIKPRALAVIAATYGQMGEAEITRQLIDELIASDVIYNDSSIGQPIDNPFALLMEAKQYESALQIAKATKDTYLRESRFSQAADGLLKQNRFDLVLPIVDEFSAANSKTQLLLAIAQRYGALEQVDQALAILAQATEVAQTIPGEESQVDRLGADGGTIIEMENDRGSLLEAIAVQYAEFKQLDRALEVGNKLQEQATRDRVIQRIQCIASS